MNALQTPVLPSPTPRSPAPPDPALQTGSPFDLHDGAAYRHWRAWKLSQRPQDARALLVPVADPRALTAAERQALLARIASANMAVYRSPVTADDKQLPLALAAQLGLLQLDANWLADEDGVSSIAVSPRTDAREGRGGFIPYTSQPIRWHTDGYYHPEQRRIHGMLLHCVRPAASGGVNRLLDHELAYIALRDESPALVRALMQADAMTIPARMDTPAESGATADAGNGIPASTPASTPATPITTQTRINTNAGAAGVARAAQAGPVFSVADGTLHMRYTARTRSIEWKNDPLVLEAAQRLAALLGGDLPWVLSLRLEPGMGIVGHNVLHDRSAFVDEPAHPRLLYRARFLDRCRTPAAAAGGL